MRTEPAASCRFGNAKDRHSFAVGLWTLALVVFYPINRYHLGMAYVAVRRFDLAGQSRRSAVETDPNFPSAASARSPLEQASKGAS